MAETNRPQFISLGHEPSTTEKSSTLVLVTEKLGFETSVNEIPVHGTPTTGVPVVQSPAVEGFWSMIDTPHHAFTHFLGAPAAGASGRVISAPEPAALETPVEEVDAIDSVALQRPTANTIKDRQNRLMAELLTRYTNLVKLATAPEEDGATLESQASLSLQMEVETTALVKAIEDLHRLTRDLKELWLAGPLRGIGEGEDDGDMATDAAVVQKLVDGITKKVRELNGGEDVQST